MGTNTNKVRPTNKYSKFSSIATVILFLGALCTVIGLTTTKQIEYTNQCPIQNAQPNVNKIYNCEVTAIKLNTESNFNNEYELTILNNTNNTSTLMSVTDEQEFLSKFIDKNNLDMHTYKNLTISIKEDLRMLGRFYIVGAKVSKVNQTVSNINTVFKFTLHEKVKENQLLLTYPVELNSPKRLEPGNYKLTLRTINGEYVPMYLENIDRQQIISL